MKKHFKAGLYFLLCVSNISFADTCEVLKTAQIFYDDFTAHPKLTLRLELNGRNEIAYDVYAAPIKMICFNSIVTASWDTPKMTGYLTAKLFVSALPNSLVLEPTAGTINGSPFPTKILMTRSTNGH